MELCSPIKVRWPVYFQFQMNKNVQWQIPPFQTCEIISNSVLESQGWKWVWRVWMGADLDNTKHFGNFFFGFFSFFFSLHENPFKHFTIIPFRIHAPTPPSTSSSSLSSSSSSSSSFSYSSWSLSSTSSTLSSLPPFCHEVSLASVVQFAVRVLKRIIGS